LLLAAAAGAMSLLTEVSSITEASAAPWGPDESPGRSGGNPTRGATAETDSGRARSQSGRQPLVVKLGPAGSGLEADSAELVLPPDTTTSVVDSGTSSSTTVPPTDRATTAVTALLIQQTSADIPQSSSTSSSTATTGEPTSTTSTLGTTTTSPGGTVVWEEHFNDLDPSRWIPEHSTYGDGNNELQCYEPENVAVSGGRLVLTARSEPATCPGDRYRAVTSGMVRSRGLTLSPGQAIEFRVKLTPADPADQGGLWPAVWASSWAGPWPLGGELDWLEVMTAEDPRRSVFSMHYTDASGAHELQNKAVSMDSYFSEDWHVVRFDYGHGGRLTWYLDGRPVFSVNGADTAQGYPAPFDQVIDEIKINLAIGGTPGPLAPGALGTTGATFEVDYIKVFDL
jgi:hypothetical protein